MPKTLSPVTDVQRNRLNEITTQLEDLMTEVNAIAAGHLGSDMHIKATRLAFRNQQTMAELSKAAAPTIMNGTLT